MAWAASLEGRQRADALMEAVKGWATIDGRAAAEYAMAGGFDSLEQREVFDRLLSEATVPFEMKQEMIETMPFDIFAGHFAFVEQWLGRDPAAVGEWLAPRNREVAESLLRAGAASWANENIEEAMVRVVEIADPGLREIAVERVLHTAGEIGIEIPVELRAVAEALGGGTP
jgi:hypothetical protein